MEDRKFGFLLRNKTISLNICIDVREVFNIKVVKETTWAALDGNMQSEVVTVQKTSILGDVHAAVEKQFGLGNNTTECATILVDIFRGIKLSIVVALLQ